jgi:hypothetical protein
MLFSLFILGCGGTPAMIPEGPDTRAELTPEEEAVEQELNQSE